MAAWMAYSILVSALLLAAAWAAERGVQMYRGPARLPWAAALTGSAAITIAAWTVPTLLPSPGIGAGVGTGSAAATSVVLDGLEATAGPAGVDLGLALGIAWAFASAVLLIRLFSAHRELARAIDTAAWRRVGGVRVALTRDLGPAVTGIRSGWVVLPRWLWRLAPGQRRLAVAHEREHLRAGDPWLLAGGRLLVTLMPWNLPLWWGLRRLRLAVETDCDRRVLLDGADPLSYGDLLLSVGERSRPVRGLAALAERSSFLERRIDQMTRAKTKWRGPKAFLAGAVALAAVAVACESPTPTDDGADATEASSQMQADVRSAESVDELPPPYKGTEASDRPSFIPYDVPPKLANAGEVQRTLQAAYPEELEQDGTGGKVILWLFVNQEGHVEKVRVQDSSGLESLDEAAKRVGLSMEFQPAMNQDRPTAVWVQQPITFRTK